MKRVRGVAAAATLVLCSSVETAVAFQNLPATFLSGLKSKSCVSALHALDPKRESLSSSSSLDAAQSESSASNTREDTAFIPSDATETERSAATNTINERLMAELKEVTEQEKSGPRSAVGKKLGLDSFRSRKTDEEREAAIAEARNLNGVNPVVALGGGAFALIGAALLWTLTNFLAEYFALHPVQNDVYFVERVSAVFRNIVMGFSALASGFFGVTGLGILLLGVRVAYGVMQGELDPTPIKRPQKDTPEMPNVWDLMMNKKPGRRGGEGKSDNFFGL